MELSFLDELGLKKNENGVFAGLEAITGLDQPIIKHSPVDGQLLGDMKTGTPQQLDAVIVKAVNAFPEWAAKPAPVRGEIVRQLGEAFRAYKQPLGKLVSYEMGKSVEEGYGEVQELIDICDFAVGLSRQLYGLTMPSERPGHKLYEQWHPLGVTGIITAFNFPVAVWSWNLMIALICGNVCIWKPSEKTPFTSLACQLILNRVFKKNGVPDGVAGLVIGYSEIGKQLAADERIPLVSATGSTRMGKDVAQTVAARLGKSILELGGNNAIIITPDADLSLVLPGIVFGAVGTAGQRCTTTRRLIIHESIYDRLRDTLIRAYSQIRVGNPLDSNNHMGPLIDRQAVESYLAAVNECKNTGGKIIFGGTILDGPGYESGCFVTPCLAEVEAGAAITMRETFAPILYLMRYRNMDEAVHLHNNVPQGLSSAIMTNNLKEAEQFLGPLGSDCGIANVNIGTSGAEIGGAFGGEKETGGGRESGSDAWKAYMRRQTVTVNYSDRLPLSQGISFSLD